MKRLRLRKWVKKTITGISASLVLVLLILINNHLEDDFVKTCEDLGYSHNYCVTHS